MKKLIRNEIRTIIPMGNEKIIVKNPTNDNIKHIQECLLKTVEGGEDFTLSNIEYLINQLTNIELECSVEELLKKDLSNECKVMLYHINSIYHEIAQEFMLNMKLLLASEKTKSLELEVINAISNK